MPFNLPFLINRTSLADSFKASNIFALKADKGLASFISGDTFILYNHNKDTNIQTSII